jgi:hypothetical protein
MEQNTTASRTCPACGNTGYVFRGRKKVAVAPGQEPAMETKYACRAYGEEWKVRRPK